MPIATNAQGQALRLDEGGKWVPTKLATNPQTGERLALDGDKWTPIAKEQPSSIVDALRSIPGGLAQGVASIMGLPGDISDMLDAGMNKLTGANVSTAGPLHINSQNVNNAISKPFGGYYAPQTTAGQIAEKAASFVPAAFGGEASLAQRALGRVLAPAAGAVAAGNAVDEKSHPLLHSLAEAGGALAAGSLGVGARTIGHALAAAQEAPGLTAQRKLADLLQRQGATSDTLTANAIPDRGQMAAEAMGPQGVTMLATLGRRSGDTGKVLAQALKGRATSASGRILSDAESASGIAPDTAAQQITDIVDRGRTLAAPLYTAAENAPPAISDYLARFAQDADVRKGMAVGVRNAQRRALAENRPFDPSSYAVTGFNDAGDPIIGGVPTWKTWDAAKVGLDDALEKYRNPITRNLELTQTGHAVDSVRRSMLGEIDQLNPQYAQARAASADYLSANSAFKQAGQHLLNSRATADQVERYFSGLSDPNKEAYRAGISNALYNLAQNGRLRPNALLTANIQSKIATAFGDEKGAQFIKALQDEASLAETGNRMKPGTGSITSDIMMMGPEVDHLATAEAAHQGAGALADLLAGSPVKAAIKGVVAARHFAPDLLRSGSLNETARNELGRMLMLSPEDLAKQISLIPPKQKLNIKAALTQTMRGS